MLAVTCWWALDARCYLLVGSGCSLLLAGGLWMLAVTCWWALDARCYLLVGSGCSLLLAGGLWMLAVTCWWALEWFLIFPDGLWMLAAVSWWAVAGSPHFLGHGTTILGLFRTLLMTTFCLVHHTTCLSGQYSPATRTRKDPGSRAAKISPGGKFRHFS